MQINTTSDALDNLNKKLGGADIEIEPSTNKVDALKKIYKTLGGTDDVKGLSTVYQVLEKITEVAEGGGGGSDTVIVTETDGTLDITPNQLKAALAEGKRVVMYYENVEEGVYEQDFISTIMQNTDNAIHTFSYMIAFYEGGAHIEAIQYYSSDGGDNPFVAD